MKIVKLEKNLQQITVICANENEKEWKNILLEAKQILGKNLKIKGFREGKIPEKVLDSQLKSDHILAKAGEIAKVKVNKLVLETHKDTLYGKYRPLITQITKITFLEVEILQKWQKLPSIEVKKSKDFNCNLNNVTVTKKEIFARLEQIADYFSTFQEKTTPISENDFVILNYQGKIKEQEIAALTKKEYNYPVGSGFFGSSFDNQLINLNKGDKKTFSLVLPSDYLDAQFAQKKITFAIEIVKIQTKKTPNIDDQLVKKLNVAKVDSVAKLEKIIHDNLLKEKINSQHSQIIELIWPKILTNTVLDVSQEYLHQETENFKNYHLQDLERKGKTLQSHLQETKKTEKEWNKAMEANTKKALIDHLLVDHLATENKISVTKEEISQYYQFLAKRNNQTEKEAREKFSELILHNNLLRFKVEKFLVENTLVFNKVVPADFFLAAQTGTNQKPKQE